jgi:hypothetical protein
MNEALLLSVVDTNNLRNGNRVQKRIHSLTRRLGNISVISWRPVLVVEEAGVPGENHRPWASNW